MSYRFNQADRKKIAEAKDALSYIDGRIQDMQSEWDEATDRWQGSDRGQSVRDWISDMESKVGDVLDLIEDIEAQSQE